MAVVKVIEVISAVRDMLTDDEGSVQRWSDNSLLRWFNEAQNEIVSKRPDLFSDNENFTCQAGSKQTLPATAVRLIDVMGTLNGSAVTQIDRKILDTHLPGWQIEATGEAEHYIYDDRTPYIFHIYPPAEINDVLIIDITKAPVSVEITDFDQDPQVMGIPDVYRNAVQEFMLHKAWDKDSEEAGNMARSEKHYKQFMVALSDVSTADAMTGAAA